MTVQKGVNVIPVNLSASSTDHRLLLSGLARSKQVSRHTSPARTKAAYLGLLLFSIVYFARPEDWIPGATRFPFAKITGFLAIAAALPTLLGPSRLKLGRGIWLLLALFGQLCLAVPFSTWKGFSFDIVVYGFSKIVVIVVVLVQVVTTFPRLRRLIFLQTAATIAVSAVSLANGEQMAGRTTGALGGIFYNPNDLSAGIVLVLPFCIAFLLSARNRFRKAVWLGAIVLSSYAVVSTFSRGGFLGMLAVSAASLWYMGVKGRRRKLLLVVLPVIFCAGLLMTTRSDYTVRIRSILNPKLDETGSAQERQFLLTRSLEVAAEHPLVGVGPGQFAEFANWHVAHNSYTEFAAEAGILAGLLFIWMTVDTFSRITRVVICGEVSPDIRLFAGALAASFIGFFVIAFFSSIEYTYTPYFLVAYGTGLFAISKQPTPGLTSEGQHHNRLIELQPCVE
jgi:hypothetical protein